MHNTCQVRQGGRHSMLRPFASKLQTFAAEMESGIQIFSELCASVKTW